MRRHGDLVSQEGTVPGTDPGLGGGKNRFCEAAFITQILIGITSLILNGEMNQHKSYFIGFSTVHMTRFSLQESY